jgi:hypothetical protein
MKAKNSIETFMPVSVDIIPQVAHCYSVMAPEKMLLACS